MSNRTLKRLTTVITAAIMTIVVIFGVSWKSAVQTFTKPAEVSQAETATQAVEVKQTEAMETQAVQETQLATEAAPATTTVAAETLPEGAATATATTADGTPITVVVQMPEQQPQQAVQQVVQQQTEDPNSEEVLTKKALAATWIHYYNGDIQANGLWEDDFNFGPNPITDGVVGEASYYDAELRERLKWDPALAAAVTAWIDAAVGTRYLGVFYEAAKEDWATAINLAKLKFSADQMAYYKNLDALFAFMNSARSVEVRPCQGVTDMMYMNPYTPSGIPDVIVMNTTDQTGYELIYQFVIKPSASGSSTSGASGASGSGASGASGGNSNTFEVAFRLNCGFQPTNVAEIMKITPQPEPSRTPTPQTEAKKPTPTPSTGSSNTSTPTPSTSGGNTSTPTPETGENPTPTPTPSTEKQTETDPDTPTPSTEKQTETDPDTPTPETIQTETNPPEPTPETTQTETNPPEPTPETTPQTETNPPEPTPETIQTETNPPEPTPQTETNPPTPTPETLPVKDPSEQQAENAEPNDNPGVGESTNNGVGAEYSTADQPENSNHYDSYEEYVEVVENLADANEVQQVGGDSNKPSYTPEVAANESPVVVDNNASTGTATSAPIDDPTPVADNLAVAANTDGEIANDPTNAGVAWEGPSD